MRVWKNEQIVVTFLTIFFEIIIPLKIKKPSEYQALEYLIHLNTGQLIVWLKIGKDRTGAYNN